MESRIKGKQVWVNNKYVADITSDFVIEAGFFGYAVRSCIRKLALKMNLGFMQYTKHLKQQRNQIMAQKESAVRQRLMQDQTTSNGVYRWAWGDPCSILSTPMESEEPSK